MCVLGECDESSALAPSRGMFGAGINFVFGILSERQWDLDERLQRHIHTRSISPLLILLGLRTCSEDLTVIMEDYY